MIIKELNLIGFGQFKNKTIELKNGLNIIYGENESGKTTIHSFIDGMFYGLLRPHVRTTLYKEEHDKYNPWNTSRYAGIITFNSRGKDYRIERIFTKGEENCQVFLEDTGEDITNFIDNGNRGRVLQPGFEFFGFNNSVYSNTVSIKQLGSKTESDLANEVRDKLVNVSTTLDENISVEEAIKQLDNSLNEIGTIRAGKSLYGTTFKELENLREEKENILKIKEEYDRLLHKESDLDNILEAKEIELDSLKDRLKNAKIIEKSNILKEAKEISHQIQTLKEDIIINSKFKDLSMDQYTEAINLNNSIEFTFKEIEKLNNRCTELNKEIKDFESEVVEDIEENVILSNDFRYYEELEEEKNMILYNRSNMDTGFIERDYSINRNTKKNYNIGIILSLLGILGFIYLGISFKSLLLGLISIVFVPGIIFFYYKLSRIKGLITRIDAQIKEIEEQKKQYNLKLEDVQLKQDKILSKYKTDSRIQLKRIYDSVQMDLINKDNRERLIGDRRKAKVSTLEEICELEENIKVKKNKLKAILERNNSNSLEEFNKGLENKKIYESTVEKLINRKDMLNRVLGKYSINELESELMELGKECLNQDESKTIEELTELINELIEDKNKIKVSISGIEQNINNLNKRVSKLVTIDEDIERKEELINSLDDKIQAITLAKSTIKDISKDIHRQFAPDINRRVEKIIENITKGRYSRVRIDDQLGIGIQDPMTKEIINLNNLSGGTIDQIYFALRYGIINSITDKELPLILDDCFIQYDNKRLNNILDFLIEASNRRQVILLTCHKREIEILENKGLDFNLISLS